MNKPLVSFLMPTFGRVARQPLVLFEAVYWFTKQTIYDDCELVILNTVETQMLECGIKNVRVHNERMIPTLGEKMNRLVELAEGKFCCVYEDDDISLPHRAEQAAQALARKEFFAPGLYYYEEKGKSLVVDPSGVQHTASAYRRGCFLGRYQATSQGHDTLAQGSAMASLSHNQYRIPPTAISYVYRWGFSDHHVSAFYPRMDEAYLNTPTGRPGTYEVKAVIDKDYQAIHESQVAVKEYMEKVALQSR